MVDLPPKVKEVFSCRNGSKSGRSTLFLLPFTAFRACSYRSDFFGTL